MTVPLTLIVPLLVVSTVAPAPIVPPESVSVLALIASTRLDAAMVAPRMRRAGAAFGLDHTTDRRRQRAAGDGGTGKNNECGVAGSQQQSAGGVVDNTFDGRGAAAATSIAPALLSVATLTVSLAPFATLMVPELVSVPSSTPLTCTSRLPPRELTAVPPLDTVGSTALPPDRTISSPPLATVALTAVPPDDTISVPPEPMLAVLSVPPAKIMSLPPLPTAAPTSLPPAETISVPPLPITVALATPPDATTAVPPLAYGGVIIQTAGQHLHRQPAGNGGAEHGAGTNLLDGAGPEFCCTGGAVNEVDGTAGAHGRADDLAAGIEDFGAAGFDAGAAGGATRRNDLRAAGDLRAEVSAAGGDDLGTAGQDPGRIGDAAREHIEHAAARYRGVARDAAAGDNFGAAGLDRRRRGNAAENRRLRATGQHRRADRLAARVRNCRDDETDVLKSTAADDRIECAAAREHELATGHRAADVGAAGENRLLRVSFNARVAGDTAGQSEPAIVRPIRAAVVDNRRNRQPAMEHQHPAAA